MNGQGTQLQSINPATGRLIRKYDEISDAEIDRILQRADAAGKDWMGLDFETRAQRMKNAARILNDRAEFYSRLMADEMGKPLSQGKAEAEKCAWVCDYFAGHARPFLEDEIIKTDAAKSYVHYAPIGVVYAVMPWNYPFWQVFRFAAPTLMAGNAAVLKHAENVTGCALEIEKIFADAGFPEGLFRTLLITREKSKQVIEHPAVKAVTLTGSTGAGRAVAAQAGAVLKKTVLELGGSDPYVILQDADLGKTVEICVNSRLLNSGQSCIAAKRFIAVDEIYDEFTRRMVELLGSKTMGDPGQNPDLGPQARADLRDNLHRQVKKSTEKGARLLLGGEMPEEDGFYYPPTVLADVVPGMPAYEEEVFGPVAAVIRARDAKDAIRIANDTAYGLGGAVFTQNPETGEDAARNHIHAGSVFVNSFVKSDPRLPFGGIGISGYGRELAAVGIREFTNIKTVYIA